MEPGTPCDPDNPIAKALYERDGVVVIKPGVDVESLHNIRQTIDRELATSVEFTRVPSKVIAGKERTPVYVHGSFGALGHGTSFHMDSVRAIRVIAHRHLLPFFSLLAQHDPEVKLEQVIDRLMVRPIGCKVAAETAHRDDGIMEVRATNRAMVRVTPEDDVVFGGWVNLDDTPQFFSCVVGDYLSPDQRTGAGFDRQAEYPQMSRICIPPGAYIVFNETILHEVLPSTTRATMYRLFLGWRLTKSDAALPVDLADTAKRHSLTAGEIREAAHRYNDHLLSNLRDWAPMYMKSGQAPRMYPRTYSRYPAHTRTLVQYSDEFVVDACKEHVGGTVMATATGNGHPRLVQMGVFPSVKTVREEMGKRESAPQPQYEDWEIELHKPNRSWLLPVVEGVLSEYKL